MLGATRKSVVAALLLALLVVLSTHTNAQGVSTRAERIDGWDRYKFGMTTDEVMQVAGHPLRRNIRYGGVIDETRINGRIYNVYLFFSDQRLTMIRLGPQAMIVDRTCEQDQADSAAVLKSLEDRYGRFMDVAQPPELRGFGPKVREKVFKDGSKIAVNENGCQSMVDYSPRQTPRPMRDGKILRVRVQCRSVRQASSGHGSRLVYDRSRADAAVSSTTIPGTPAAILPSVLCPGASRVATGRATRTGRWRPGVQEAGVRRGASRCAPARSRRCCWVPAARTRRQVLDDHGVRQPHPASTPAHDRPGLSRAGAKLLRLLFLPGVSAGRRCCRRLHRGAIGRACLASNGFHAGPDSTLAFAHLGPRLLHFVH